MKKYLFFLLLSVFITACLKEESPFLPFTGIQPRDIQDGWEIATPNQENMDEAKLSNIFRALQEDGSLYQLRSLLVFRNNKLLAETYFKDENDISITQPIWSCTKQVLGILTGLAIEKEIIKDINDPISNYLSDDLKEHPDKNSISLENLLTMRSGIDFDEVADFSILLQNEQGNTLNFLLGMPMFSEPGQQFHYSSGDSHLAGACIQSALGRTLEAWADELLFSKIGFTNYSWLKYDGYNVGGHGISTTPREMAKIAQLVLNQGNWKGEQLITSSWINKMTTTQTDTGVVSDYSFGYHWWINEKEGIYFMAGSGGQFAAIVPAKNLLVVSTAEHDTDGDQELGFDTFLEIVKKIIATTQ